MAFERGVFVNCPFDDAYYPLLRPLLFTVTYLGLEPRIALEELDSGKVRMEQILKLLKESKYGVHDLSRLQATVPGEYYRLNMPFELGLDVGSRIFSRGRLSRKRCLVLGKEPFRYQAALSDMAGSDIAVHGDDPIEVVVQVRNWLTQAADLPPIGPARIWAAFGDFMAENYTVLKAKGFSDANIERLPIGELVRYMKDWVTHNT